MENQSLSARIVKEAFRVGINEFCVCPGARNYEIVNLLIHEKKIITHFHIDERGAAFYAVGKIKKYGTPVAVVVTSGTAVGELLPATMEAYYTGLPLLLITADRPRSYRKTGAPQTAEQAHLFGQYAPFYVDVENEEPVSLAHWNQMYPAQINVALEEALGKEPTEIELNVEQKQPIPVYSYEGWNINADRICLQEEGHKRLEEFFKRSKHPLIVVSTLKQRDREDVIRFLQKIQAPVVLESPSGIREDTRLEPLRVNRTSKIVEVAEKSGYPIDGVLRIGGVPTFRLWRDIENQFGKKELFSVNDVPFTGISWGTMAFAPIHQFFRNFSPKQTYDASTWLAVEKKYAQNFLELVDLFPRAQISMAHRLSKVIPAHSQIFLGNSLSIRDWDMAASWENKGITPHATRGLNGIDGQIATFLGMHDPQVENWALLGDLTTLYDMNGFWILGQHDLSFRFVVANNFGGKIFSGKFSNPIFQNRHHIRFEHLAKFWGLDYLCWNEIPSTFSSASKKIFIEMIPDEEQTQIFAKKLGEL